MRGIVRATIMTACAGAAVLSVAACGTGPAGQQAGAGGPTGPTTGRHTVDDHGGLRHGGDDALHGTAPAGAVAPATISGHEPRGTYACGNQAVTISATDAKITLAGACRSVTVTGDDNKVLVGGAGTITVSGTDNTVTWQGGPAPTVRDSGADNVVTQG